jgi:hypothetical protein
VATLAAKEKAKKAKALERAANKTKSKSKGAVTRAGRGMPAEGWPWSTPGGSRNRAAQQFSAAIIKK